MAQSYYEIGGRIVECLLDTPDVSHHGQTAQQRKTDRIMMKGARKASIEALDHVVGDSYDVKKGITGGTKVRQGTKTVGRGIAIAATLAAMDGPLPFGDVLAAGFLIGGGSYLIYSGAKDVIQ